jgi:hypothetical protein
MNGPTYIFLGQPNPSLARGIGGALAGGGAVRGAALAAGRGRASHGQYSHFHAALLFVLYRESLMKYTGVRESDFTAHG